MRRPTGDLLDLGERFGGLSIVRGFQRADLCDDILDLG